MKNFIVRFVRETRQGKIATEFPTSDTSLKKAKESVGLWKSYLERDGEVKIKIVSIKENKLPKVGSLVELTSSVCGELYKVVGTNGYDRIDVRPISMRQGRIGVPVSWVKRNLRRRPKKAQRGV